MPRPISPPPGRRRWLLSTCLLSLCGLSGRPRPQARGPSVLRGFSWLRKLRAFHDVPRCRRVLGARAEDSSKAKPQHEKIGQAVVTETATLDREEAAEFSVRLGRWSLQVLQCLASPDWCRSLLVGHIVRTPVNHMFLWLQSVAADDRPASDLPPVVVLVCGQAERIMRAFDRLLDSSILEGPWEQVAASCDGDRGWRSQVQLSLVEAAADYWRRLVLPTKRYPLRAAWLCGQPPLVCCSTRADVCREILEGSLGDLDGDCSLLQVLRVHFGCLLRAGAAAGGKVDDRLFRFMKGVCGP